jgi:hypothetical protein
MKDVNMASQSRPHLSGDERDDVEDPSRPFTPGQFFLQAGILIAVCLGLAQLARILVAILGAR